MSYRERWRYLAYGLRQVMGSFGSRALAHPARCDLGREEVRSKVDQGASPLRVYTCALMDQVDLRFLGAGGPICDLGCGSGQHSRFFERCNGRHFYIGLDHVFRPQWSQGAPGETIPRRFAQMSVTQLGLASDSLAFTFSSSTLEHVTDPAQTIQELKRTMRPGAYGVHVVPGVWALFLYMFHGYRRFSPATLTALARDAGLEVVRVWALGGTASFFLHALWITWLEQGAVYGWLIPPPPPGERSWVRFFYIGGRMRSGFMRTLYAGALRVALHIDRWMPWLPAGYGLLIRKPAEAA